MLALLRKEAREALVGLVLLSGLLSWLAVRAGANVVVPSADSQLLLVAILAVAIGVCHGFGEFAIEERNTWRYLVHRSTGHRGAFMAKLMVDWAVLALLTVIPLLVSAAWVVWFTDDAPIALWSRYFEVVTTATIAFGAHAIGVFAAQLRRPTWLRFAIAFAGSILFLIASTFVTLAPYGATLGPAARYLLWIAAISLPLYAISYRMFVASSDDDRAFPGKLGIGVAVSALALLAPSAAFVVGAVASMPLQRIVNSQPQVWRGNHGDELHLTQTVDLSSRELDEVVHLNPGSTRVFARTTATSTARFDMAESLRSIPTQPFEFGAAWEELLTVPRTNTVHGGVWFGKRERRIAIVRHKGGGAKPSLFLLGKGDSGEEFSSLARAIHGGDEFKICFADPKDRSLWSLDPNAAEPKVEQISLPDNDAFLRIDQLFATIPSIEGDHWELFEGVWVVVGARGRYRWNGERFLSAKRPWNWALASGPTAHPDEFRIDIARPDALEPTVVVYDAETGAKLFEHSYTNRFDLRTATAFACSLVRPTIGSVVSFFHDAPADYRDIDAFIDPLLTSGRRVWLLMLNVLLSGAIATIAWRRGTAGDPRRVFDALAILLLGVPAALVLWLVEPRGRVVRKVVAATAPREQLLISSV